MSDSWYTVRNYQPADFDQYVHLNLEAARLEPARRCLSSPAIAEHLERLNYCPEQDLFVIATGDNLIGYLDMTCELSIGRVILDGWVHPEHRRRGLATKLLEHSIQRAQELGAKVAHVNILQGNTAAKSVLSKLGFKCVRQFLEMRLDLAKAGWQDSNQTTLSCRHLKPGEEGKLAQIQNRAFADTWGYNPNSASEITVRTKLGNRSPEDIVLACDGPDIIGYCWTEIADGGRAGSSQKKGRIFMLGVDPGYRGRGTGKTVLRAGLAHLKARGIQIIDLTVDSENKAACALYQAAGFKTQTRSYWYEKAIS